MTCAPAAARMRLSVAASLPVKLLFPLVICFLAAAILVATLGPTFYQIFQFLDGLTRGGLCVTAKRKRTGGNPLA